MSVLQARSPGRSLCFRCPGGRIGANRFRAFLDLVGDVSDLTLMVSRRQALAVRGPLGEVPDYLYQELSADEISGPNVKSYPYSANEDLQHYMIDRLGVLSAKTSGVTYSYSPHRLYRGNLRLDDFSLRRESDETFTLETRLWSTDPRTLMDGIPRRELPMLFNAMEELLNESAGRQELSSRPFRNVRKKLFKFYNRADLGDFPPPPSDSESASGTVLCERTILETDDSGEIYDGGEGKFWVILPVVAGILSDSATRSLISVLDRFDLQSMRLTPEQNILLPVKSSREATEVSSVLGGRNVSADQTDLFPRVSTCPGSIFCSNVETEPVELTRKLADSFAENDALAEFNRMHSIGITGCGETRELERRHPVGIYPNSTEEYRLSIGGNLHGDGRLGVELNESFRAETIPRVLARVAELFEESSERKFHEWCHRNEAELVDAEFSKTEGLTVPSDLD